MTKMKLFSYQSEKRSISSSDGCNLCSRIWRSESFLQKNNEKPSAEK